MDEDEDLALAFFEYDFILDDEAPLTAPPPAPVPVTAEQPPSSSSSSSSSTNNINSTRGLAACSTVSGSTTTSDSNSCSQQTIIHNTIKRPGQDNNNMQWSVTAQQTSHLHPLGIQSSASCPPTSASLLPNPMEDYMAGTITASGVHNNAKPPPPGTAAAVASTTQQRQQGRETPPFLLFDAPAELRHNFIQCQRAHGMTHPVMFDDNSIHYGRSVKGFHPQNPSLALKKRNADLMATARSGGGGGGANSAKITLKDARHTARNKAKNAKEQKRAQRITSLIEELRHKMETGGWKVGMKSKFQTLASCADYVRYLVKLTKEKEAAVHKAKSDLEAKHLKMEEEKAQQDPSDPESTTSSLTVSSGSETTPGAASKKAPVNFEQEKDPAPFSDAGKRRLDSSGESKAKKPRLTSHESSFSSAASSGGDDSRKQGPEGVHSVSIDGAETSISTITDSAQGSSLNSSGSDWAQSSRGSRHHSSSSKSKESCSSSSVSSNAAVASKGHSHSDVVIQERRALKTAVEATSLDRRFELDYEEVFLKSNVPQLLASTSGRIVSWNEFFLKATGLSKEEVSRLTIFSLVKPGELSKLFEIVADALKEGSSDATSDSEAKDEADDGEGDKEKGVNFTAASLPCVSFQSKNNREGNATPLYIALTLVSDPDPQKRCFHCVFSDSPGIKGVGTITPELLRLLFTLKEENEA